MNLPENLVSPINSEEMKRWFSSNSNNISIEIVEHWKCWQDTDGNIFLLDDMCCNILNVATRKTKLSKVLILISDYNSDLRVEDIALRFWNVLEEDGQIKYVEYSTVDGWLYWQLLVPKNLVAEGSDPIMRDVLLPVYKKAALKHDMGVLIDIWNNISPGLVTFIPTAPVTRSISRMRFKVELKINRPENPIYKSKEIELNDKDCYQILYTGAVDKNNHLAVAKYYEIVGPMYYDFIGDSSYKITFVDKKITVLDK